MDVLYDVKKSLAGAFWLVSTRRITLPKLEDISNRYPARTLQEGFITICDAR